MELGLQPRAPLESESILREVFKLVCSGTDDVTKFIGTMVRTLSNNFSRVQFFTLNCLLPALKNREYLSSTILVYFPICISKLSSPISAGD